MDHPDLTKESRRVLRDIYKAYMERRDSGMSKSSAVYFSSPVSGGSKIAGFDDASGELRDAGYIKMDIVGGFEIKDKAIIFMENFTKDRLLKWVEFGAQFIP